MEKSLLADLLFVFGTWLPSRYGAADPIVLEVMGELAGDYLSGPGKNQL